MTEQQPPTRTAPAGALATVFVVALLGWLGIDEGNSNTAYLDTIANPPVWTICRGVTGPDVVENTVWTDEQCIARETQMVQDFNTRVVRCIPGVKLTMYEHMAYLAHAWNVGPTAFCNSSIVTNLKAGNYERACARIEEAFFRAGGKDCRVRANKCYGLILRRKATRAVCEGRLSIPGLLQ